MKGAAFPQFSDLRAKNLMELSSPEGGQMLSGKSRSWKGVRTDEGIAFPRFSHFGANVPGVPDT